MKKLLLLALLALPALAETPAREIFPDDYTPSPCATGASEVCRTQVPKERFRNYASTARRFDLKQAWVNEHWDEMTKLFVPICTKIGNCFSVKGNDWVYCIDQMFTTFQDTCAIFPEGTDDARQCRLFSTTYFLALGAKTAMHAKAQECAAAQPASATPRKLVAWVVPDTFEPGFDGEIHAYAYDAETHIPVFTAVSIDGGNLRFTEGPITTSFYTLLWKAGYKIQPSAAGHRDLVPPSVIFTEDGYETAVVPIHMPVPTLKVGVTPAPSEWKTGTNTITVTATDAETGKPAEMRVMAGDRVIGNANRPVTLTWEKGAKRPEIWITSLWDRYSDVVVAAPQ